MPHEDHEPCVLDYARQGSYTPWWRGRWITIFLLVGNVSLLLAILLPALLRPHPQSKRSICLSNLHQIGVVIAIYSAENKGQFPQDLQAEVRRQLGGLSGGVFICPADETGAACTYVYIKGHTGKSPPKDVVAYEPLGLHDKPGAGVLFVDGSVVRLTPAQHKAAIARTRAKLAASVAQPATRPAGTGSPDG